MYNVDTLFVWNFSCAYVILNICNFKKEFSNVVLVI